MLGKRCSKSNNPQSKKDELSPLLVAGLLVPLGLKGACSAKSNHKKRALRMRLGFLLGRRGFYHG